jgi:hypothetical protein
MGGQYTSVEWKASILSYEINMIPFPTLRQSSFDNSKRLGLETRGKETKNSIILVCSQGLLHRTFITAESKQGYERHMLRNMKECPSGDNQQTGQTRVSITSPLTDVTESEMFVSGAYYSNGTWRTGQPSRLLVDYWTVLYTFLRHNNETWQVLSHYLIPTLFKQWQCYWQNWPKPWQTMETEMYLTSWTKPTQGITLLLNVWLWWKFFKRRANFKRYMSDHRCDNSTRCCKELDKKVGHNHMNE